jgi:tetratricopeptide (TPR) repeat protein
VARLSIGSGFDARLSALKKRSAAYSARGKFRCAESCLLEALQLARNGSAQPNPEFLVLWNELGMVYKYLGEFRKAQKFYRLALAQARRLLAGSEYYFFLANLYHNLGGLEHARRRFRRGETYARKSLHLRRKVAGRGSLSVAADTVALAAILDGLHKFKESEKLYRRALKIYRREYGESHREIALILNNLGALYHATHRPKRAEAQYRAALQMKRRELGASHPDVAITMNNLAMLCESQGRGNEARLWYNKTLRILRVSLGDSHPTARAVRRNFRKLEQSNRDHSS